MKGRPPKPTALKLIEGNRGHRALPTNEPKPAPGIPSCPQTIKGEARREWRRITRELQHIGLLTKVDRAALVSYCLAWSRLLEAQEHLMIEGAVVAGRQAGFVKSPWHVVQCQAMTLVRAFCSEFGLTPSSRCRIQLPSRKERPLSEIAAERAAAVRAAAKKNPA